MWFPTVGLMSIKGIKLNFQIFSVLININLKYFETLYINGKGFKLYILINFKFNIIIIMVIIYKFMVIICRLIGIVWFIKIDFNKSEFEVNYWK